MIQLHVLPEVNSISGEEFKTKYGSFSIALDGFVNEAPWFDFDLPSQNFNHHEQVSRLETRATCAQVLMALQNGLLYTFRQNDEPHINVYVNDCDEDVCLSWWLLKNHHISTSIYNPLLNKLVHFTDMLDTTAGAFPFYKDSEFLSIIAWIYEPYREFRNQRGLSRRNAAEFRSVIENVGLRISAYISGHFEKIIPDTRYKIIQTYPDYVHVEEIGSQARLGLFRDGIKAFVASSKYSDEKWMHIIGRQSQYIPFPVKDILQALDQEEAGVDHWGGGDTIGGAPRTTGSHISPEEVAQIINNLLDKT